MICFLFVITHVLYNKMFFFAYLEVGVRVQGQLTFGALGADEVKGLAQGPPQWLCRAWI